MRHHLPNALTMLRLALAAVFFVALNRYRYPQGPAVALWSAMALFVLAALTDWLDGHLARRLHAETTFGRIMDPFCDKVLVLGAFLYLAGPRFAAWPAAPGGPPDLVSGVYPWMVMVMLARELLVTGIRGEFEQHGRRFGARQAGKLKALLQMVAVPALLGIIALDPLRPGQGWLQPLRDGLVYAVVLATVLSGLPYVRAAVGSIRQPAGEARRSGQSPAAGR